MKKLNLANKGISIIEIIWSLFIIGTITYILIIASNTIKYQKKQEIRKNLLVVEAYQIFEIFTACPNDFIVLVSDYYNISENKIEIKMYKLNNLFLFFDYNKDESDQGITYTLKLAFPDDIYNSSPKYHQNLYRKLTVFKEN